MYNAKTLVERTIQRGGVGAILAALILGSMPALAADYGLNGGMHDWRTFSLQIAIALVADMGLDRHYFIQERFDGRPLNLKANLNVQTTGDSEGTAVTAPGFSFSRTVLKDYQLLRNLDKIYVYTDYAPREEGSEKYDQSNQPDEHNQDRNHRREDGAVDKKSCSHPLIPPLFLLMLGWLSRRSKG